MTMENALIEALDDIITSDIIGIDDSKSSSSENSGNSLFTSRNFTFSKYRSVSSSTTRTIKCQHDFEDDLLGNADDDENLEELSFDEFSPNIYDTPLFKSTIPNNGTGLPMIFPGPHHINVVSEKPEDLHSPSEGLISRMILHDSERLNNPPGLLNRLVFDCIDPSPMHDQIDEENFNSAKKTPFQRKLRQYYVPNGDEDTTLVFESRFESGNLRRAIQVYEYEYDLILKFDVNTRGHTQWFYFSVANVKKNTKYKFNIINMMKSDSLYNYGMKPIVYSEHNAKHKGIGWERCGFDICYYQNTIKRKNGYFYTTTWSYVFPNEKDTYYFACCYPYTYTNLQNYLSNLEKDPTRKKFFRRRTLCQTLAGNNCDLLTITTFSCDPKELQNRKGVVISSRVHPGESNASWMMKGIIDYLTGPSLDAQILRDHFVFKIVPMLNPDGVINGNYRCSLAGVDLNRRWSDPSKRLHPTIYYTKQMIKKFSEDREVIIFCDLHGHSRKKNIFIYGCANKNDSKQKLAARVFPRVLWKISHNFSFDDCSFHIHKSKESTARVVVFKEIGLMNSFTLEASFCGSNFGKNNAKHFNTRHLEQMGHFFCEAILDYCDPEQGRVNQIVKELEMIYLDLSTPFIDEESGEKYSSMGSDEDFSENDMGDEIKNLKKKKLKRKKAKKKVKEKEEKPKKQKKSNQGTCTTQISSHQPNKVQKFEAKESQKKTYPKDIVTQEEIQQSKLIKRRSKTEKKKQKMDLTKKELLSARKKLLANYESSSKSNTKQYRQQQYQYYIQQQQQHHQYQHQQYQHESKGEEIPIGREVYWSIPYQERYNSDTGSQKKMKFVNNLSSSHIGGSYFAPSLSNDANNNNQIQQLLPRLINRNIEERNHSFMKKHTIANLSSLAYQNHNNQFSTTSISSREGSVRSYQPQSTSNASMMGQNNEAPNTIPSTNGNNMREFRSINIITITCDIKDNKSPTDDE